VPEDTPIRKARAIAGDFRLETAHVLAQNELLTRTNRSISGITSSRICAYCALRSSNGTFIMCH